MGIKRRLLIMGILVSLLNIGCVTFVTTTDWLAETPIEQGIVKIYLWQESAYLRAITHSWGSVSIKLNSSERIKELKLLTSEATLRFLKDGAIVKEQRIFPEPYQIGRDNSIFGVISTYNKYTSPDKDKQYSLNWDEVMEALNVSDKIECGIDLKFEANGKLYSIQKVVELKRDLKKEIVWGIAD